MSFVPFKGFGKFGVVHDSPAQALPLGVWTNARNIRFSGIQMEKMLEPTIFTPWDSDTNGTALWMQGWADGLSTYLAVASSVTTQTESYHLLWFLRRQGLGDPGTWVQVGGPYNSDGQWQSFAWGDTCIFNNGVDAPQIFNNSLLEFEDLPRWGLISSAEDLTNNTEPTKQVQAACTHLYPLKSFLVASGVTEGGLYQPNKIWWSDATALASFKDTGDKQGPPSWDYESPSTLSAQSEIAPESGAIRTAELLNDQLVIYTDAAATALSVVGGALVMASRRLFNKGACSLHSVCEFNNNHFCISQDQIYIHDGSTPRLIAKDRVEEEFFTRLGKGGRFGDDTVDWTLVQAVKNPDRKEIIVTYGALGEEVPINECCMEYDCDAIETALLGMNNVDGLWSFTFLNAQSDDSSTPDLTANGYDMGRGAGQLNGFLPITPCTDTLVAGAGDFGVSNSEFFGVFAPIGALPARNFFTVGGMVRPNALSPYKRTLFELNDARRTSVYYINSTGDLQILVYDITNNSNNVIYMDFPGAMGAYSSEWRTLVVHLDARTAGAIVSWVEVDGVRTTGSSTKTALTNDGGNNPRFNIMGGSADPGSCAVDVLYPFHYIGEMTTTELDTFYDAISRNKADYTDPNTACIDCPDDCKVYECDAYETAILGLSGGVYNYYNGKNGNAGVEGNGGGTWNGTLIYDAMGNDDLVITNQVGTGFNPNYAYTGPQTDCGAGTSYHLTAETGTNGITSANVLDPVLEGTGTICVTVAHTAGGTDVTAGADWGSSEYIRIMYDNINGWLVSARANGTNGGLPDTIWYVHYNDFTWTPDPTGTNTFAVVWTKEDDDHTRVKLYHNWQFVGEAVRNGLVGGGGDNGGAFGPFTNRASNHGTGMAFRDWFYTPTPMSNPQVETLRSAWLQNEESYTDPNCTPAQAQAQTEPQVYTKGWL